MGSGLVLGLLDSGGLMPSQFTATDVRQGALEALSSRGVDTSLNMGDVVKGHDVVILGIKPQTAPEVLPQLGAQLDATQVLVSIVAGVNTARIEAALDRPIPVIRTMPQIVARLGVAATALCRGAHADDDHAALVQRLFELVGCCVAVDESQMDAVTGLSGSGPAYVYTIIEALADGGVRAGLPREVASQLAAQTVMGAARMVIESEEHPAELRDRVTSPGGTTLAGLRALEEGGLREALISAVQAAARRSSELGKLGDES